MDRPRSKPPVILWPRIYRYVTSFDHYATRLFAQSKQISRSPHGRHLTKPSLQFTPPTTSKPPAAPSPRPPSTPTTASPPKTPSPSPPRPPTPSNARAPAPATPPWTRKRRSTPARPSVARTSPTPPRAPARIRRRRTATSRPISMGCRLHLRRGG